MASSAYRPVSDLAGGQGEHDGSSIELLSPNASSRPMHPSYRRPVVRKPVRWQSQPQALPTPSTPKQDPEYLIEESRPADESVHHVRSWPTKPARLAKSLWSAIVFDLLAVIVPLPFLALAILALRADGKAVHSKSWRQYQNATRVAATLFPIAFAAVAGRMVTKIAARKLERGASLGSLEQLIGSRTVFSTLSTQVNLRSLNVLGTSLTLYWALSPLGGQSALRIIDTGFESLRSNSSVLYFDTGAQSEFAQLFDGDPAGLDQASTILAVLNAMYTASLLSSSSVKSSTMDLWGNVKIPYLSSYQSHPVSGWTDVPSWPAAQYSSLIGVPISGVKNGNTSFLAESSYMEIQCSNISKTLDVIPLNFTFLEDFENCPEDIDCPLISNGTYQGLGLKNTSTTWTLGLDTFVDRYWYNATTLKARNITYDDGYVYAYPGFFINETGIPTSPGTLLFQSYNVIPQMYSISTITHTRAYCKAAEVYVESRVNCSQSPSLAQNCSVVAQRPSIRHHAPESITHFSWPQVFRYVSEKLPLATGQEGLGGTSDLALYYINNTSTASMTNTDQYAILDNIPEKQFSQRLGQVLNTYLLLGQAYTSVTGVTEANFLYNISASATVSHLEEIYVISKAWITVFILATLTLLGAALVSVVVGHTTTAPELLGHVSSAIRDSRHVHLPPGGGTLSGFEMAICLKHVDIRYGVVGRDLDGVGTLGVSVRERVKGTSKNALYK